MFVKQLMRCTTQEAKRYQAVADHVPSLIWVIQTNQRVTQTRVIHTNMRVMQTRVMQTNKRGIQKQMKKRKKKDCMAIGRCTDAKAQEGRGNNLNASVLKFFYALL